MFEPERISLSDSQRAELARMLEHAVKLGSKAGAKEAAREALREIGLHDAQAAKDIQDMRDLLSAWRQTRKEMWHTIVRVATTAALGLIAAAVWVYSSK